MLEAAYAGIRVVDKLLCAIINRGNGRAEVFIASITCSIALRVRLNGVALRIATFLRSASQALLGPEFSVSGQ